MANPGLVSMQLTPSGEPAFWVLQDVPYPAGQSWIYWDGRDPDGEIVTSSSSIFYPAPSNIRPNAIHVLSAAPGATWGWQPGGGQTWGQANLGSTIGIAW